MSCDMANTRRGDPERALLVPLQRLRIGEVVGARHGGLVEPAHVCSFGAPKRKAPASGGHGGERHDSARMAAKLIILSRLLQQKNEEALRAASVTQHGTAFLHEMERIYLAACLPLLDTATTPTPPTAANVRTLFAMTGSSLTRAQLYDATLTLKDRLPFAIASST